MKTQSGFTLMTIDEFEDWLPKQSVSRTIKLIQEHHTWSPAYAQFTGSNHFSLQSGMKSYHINSAGYADIAQQFTTFPDGMICTGRSMNTAPAGIKGANSNGICIENLGNFDAGYDVMTDAQKDTIVRMTAALLNKFGLDAETGVTYHCWWTDSGTYLGGYVPGESCKTCPGTNFFGGNTMKAYKANLKPLIEAAMKGESEMTEAQIRDIVTKTVVEMDVTTTAKNAAQDVVQETFTRIYNNANPLYTSLEQIPDYWKTETEGLIECGAIQGDGTHEVSIRRDALQSAVIAFRMMKGEG